MVFLTKLRVALHDWGPLAIVGRFLGRGGTLGMYRWDPRGMEIPTLYSAAITVALQFLHKLADAKTCKAGVSTDRVSQGKMLQYDLVVASVGLLLIRPFVDLLGRVLFWESLSPPTHAKVATAESLSPPPSGPFAATAFQVARFSQMLFIPSSTPHVQQ